MPYDLLLRGGHVIDPANNVDARMDVAVTGDRIARVAPSIPASEATKSIDAAGLHVTPGLIDLHTHVYLRARRSTLQPDDTSLVTGATTVCDAGCSGWRTFEDFKATIIDKVQTRVLAFLNIVGQGMRDGAAGESNLKDMDPGAAAAKVKQYPEILVGIKHAHYERHGWDAIERAVEAGRLAGKPVIIDDDIFTDSGRNTRRKVLEVMRPGDIHTHMYNDGQLELLDRFTGKVQPYMWEARKRGVLFDMGHGGGGFLWPIASRAMQQGFPPDTLGTDLHPTSIMNGVNIPNCISKLMALGMGLPDAIRRATLNPARAIGRFPELGTLGEGRAADIAVFRLESGVFPLCDSRRKKLLARQRLRCVMTIRNGAVVFDEDGLSCPDWRSQES